MERRLFHFDACPFCEKVRMALALDGRSWSPVEVDPDDRAPVEAISGQARVPVLVEDGTVHVDSTTILRHLSGLAGSTLLPRSRREGALAWIVEDRADAILAPLCYRIKRRRTPDGTALTDDDVRAAELRLRDELAALEGILERGSFLFGDRPTVADVGTHAILNRLTDEARAPLFEGLARVPGWYDRVVAAVAAGRSRT